MASTNNPLSNTTSPSPSSFPPPKSYNIAGITVSILGLSSLPQNCTSLTILYLLHPRLQSASTMLPIGTHILTSWAAHQASLPPSHPSKSAGLLALTFDQRNHGARLVDPVGNDSWRDGNPRHAQDMFGVYNGTATDVSLLIDHVGSYIAEDFQGVMPEIGRNLVLGVSLGGHAAWQVLFAEPRVEAGVVVIGCPDYMRVMTDRARLSKRQTYTLDAGATFLGSRDFPPSLLSAIQKWDPRGILFGAREIPSHPPTQDSPREEARLKDILESRVKGKSVLVCSGGADKLVPYKASEPFLGWLKEAVGRGGWWEGGMGVRDVVYEGAGHEFTEAMVKDSVKFVVELMEGRGVEKGSKI
ncbi:hypothetical protein VE01_09266 [Pseudogymnoascus verrucosus]|uniref:AB hydrolase-1 domain-containing protein n=1 Tax=Pseudogymnoascus verrucosus TaxID=342668 RepID=A0A1B8G993_9PEZI|nr:uncharacterized protein VE01_09266 [Pseudogymnoascus verrucosus]OBT92392.1 hypothetical protein VE01_09266 [Pseudogymnoascus verrucosus]